VVLSGTVQVRRSTKHGKEMTNLTGIVQHTPPWVFALFAVLVWFGVQSLRDRTLPLWRILAIPAVFIGWGTTAVIAKSADLELTIWWATSLLIAATLAWSFTGNDGLQREPATGQIRVAGSALPIIRNMMIFWTKYLVAIGIASTAMNKASLFEIDMVASGVSAGYFLGWVARFLQWYNSAGRRYALNLPDR